MTLVGPLTLVMGEDNGKNAASASGSPLAGENKFDVIHEIRLKEKETIDDMPQCASVHKPCGVVCMYTLKRKNNFAEMLQNMSVHKPGGLVLIASVCKPFGLACDYTPNRKNSDKDFLQGGGTA